MGDLSESWDDVSEELIIFYKDEKEALWRAVDKIFRKSVAERIDLTLLDCKGVDGKRILDIGCGLGTAALELTRRGARITSLRLPSTNIEKAAREEFVLNAFKEDFHVSLALGFFDFVEDPLPYLAKMRSLTKEKCIMSFPSQFAFQVPLRVIWLRSKKCPVYFYTKKRIKRFLGAEFSRYKIKNISAGYYCVAHV